MTSFMIKQPLKKLERNELTAMLFYGEFLIVTLLTGIFVLCVPLKPGGNTDGKSVTE